jgi:hypothetical protein
VGGGVLSQLFRQINVAGLPIKPQLIQNELVIEFTEEEFKEATTKDLDPRMKQAIKIEFRDGKMVIRVRLI